jgi:hypothetical protein
MIVGETDAEAELPAIADAAFKAEEVGEAGNPRGARDQLVALLPKAERTLDPEHPQVLTIRNRLAHWTGEAGSPESARDQARLLLPVVERVRGHSHPDTLAVRANIARLTRASGDKAGARDQFNALLPEFGRVLGAEHAETFVVRLGLAWSTGEAMEPAEARDQFAALLPVAKRVLGPEHPSTLDCRAGLARWIGSTENAATARDEFAALLPVFERVRGREHPETLYVRHCLARWTGKAGNPEAARAQNAALLPIRERVLGPDHPATAVTKSNLSRWAKAAASGSVPDVTRTLAISELVDRVEAAETSADKGISLESLMSALFEQVPGFTVTWRNVRTETEEIDIVVLNDSQDPVYSRDGPLVLVECKNWATKPGRPEFSLLEGKMRNRHGRCTVGYLVSWCGFANTTSRESLRLSRENYVIVCLTGSDVRQAALEGNFPEFLRRVTLETLTS